MDVLFLVLISGLIIYFFISSGKKEYHYKKVISRHGHRCYSEGLTGAELTVVNRLSEGLSHKDYFIFNNLILPSENGGSTQIDHVVVSKFGIFVIESKDYHGWVFGSKNRKEWTVTYKGGSKYHFQNPLFQNIAHTSALRSIMPFIAKGFISVVVFSDRCEFKTDRITNVVYLSELMDYIHTFTQIQLQEAELLLVIGKLSYMCQAVDITAQEHVANVKKHISNSVT